jgi:glycosyltransferase involved in cell wall biosynthesis
MKFFERRNVRMADEVVSASRFIGRNTMDVLGLAAKPFTTLYHGVDTDWFRPGVESSTQEVLFVGTVKKQKGIQELFQAIPRILQAAPGARFTIVGRYPDDPAAACSPASLLRALPRDRNDGLEFSRSARVRFLGQVAREELPGLYRRAAVAVFPSYVEAFGLACVEAMSCGAAVVSTEGGSGPELVKAGESGLLVESGDSRALAAAIVRLLSDAALRSRLGTAARSRVVENFDLRDAATRNLALYEQVVRRIPRRQPMYV